MSQIILVTGGNRSGKSGYAQRRAEAMPGSRGYLATCPRIDGEMDTRIEAHRREREGKGWETVESPLDLSGAILVARETPVLLVDCLTLWANNLLYRAEQKAESFGEAEAAAESHRVLQAARAHGGTIFFVTNELGMGIVPENLIARKFRDIAGRMNQIFAGESHEVVLLVSGLPMILKSSSRDNHKTTT